MAERAAPDRCCLLSHVPNRFRSHLLIGTPSWIDSWTAAPGSCRAGASSLLRPGAVNLGECRGVRIAPDCHPGSAPEIRAVPRNYASSPLPTHKWAGEPAQRLQFAQDVVSD